MVSTENRITFRRIWCVTRMIVTLQSVPTDDTSKLTGIMPWNRRYCYHRMIKMDAISSPLSTYFKTARKWNLQLTLGPLTVKLFVLWKRWKTYTLQPHKYAPSRCTAVCAARVCSLSLEPSWLTRGSQSPHQIRTPELASGDDRDTEEKSQQWLPDAFEMPKLQSASSCLIKCYSDYSHLRDLLAPPFSSVQEGLVKNLEFLTPSEIYNSIILGYTQGPPFYYTM